MSEQEALAAETLIAAAKNKKPEQPYGPGAICGDCGHFAMRHGEEGCVGVRAEVGCLFGEGTEANPKKCKGFLWQGVRWPQPWSPDGYQKEEGK